MTMAFQKLTKLLNFKNLPTPQPVFGVRLDRNATEIPVVVRKAIAFFEKKGVEVEGLFRISSNAQHLAELMERFDTGEDVDVMQIEEHHLVAGMLKQYFLQLPEPLLTFELYDCFLAATGVAQQQALFAPVKKALQYLPPGHFLVLSALVRLLNFVSKSSSKNKMTAANLSITFAPSLMRPESDPRFSVMVKDTGRANAFLEILISNYEELFFEGSTSSSSSVQLKAEEHKQDEISPSSSSHPQNLSQATPHAFVPAIIPSPSSSSNGVALKSKHWKFCDLSNPNVVTTDFLLSNFPRVAFVSASLEKYVVCLRNRLYASYLHSNPMQCWKTTSELFTIWHQEEGEFRISIMTDRGTYWSSGDGGEITHKETQTLQKTELFDVEINAQDKVALRSVANGTVLFFNSEGMISYPTKTLAPPSPTSELLGVNIKVSMRVASTGKYVSALETGIEANRTLALVWEMFIIQSEGSGLCSIGRYSADQVLAFWHANPDGTLDAQATSPSTETELFYLEEQEPFQFTIRTCYGTYFQLDVTTNKVVASSFDKDANCIFTLVPLTVPIVELNQALQQGQNLATNPTGPAAPPSSPSSPSPSPSLSPSPSTGQTPHTFVQTGTTAIAASPTNANGFRWRKSTPRIPAASLPKSKKPTKSANLTSPTGIPSGAAPSPSSKPPAPNASSAKGQPHTHTFNKAQPTWAHSYSQSNNSHPPPSPSPSPSPSSSPMQTSSSSSDLAPPRFKAAKMPTSSASPVSPSPARPGGGGGGNNSTSSGHTETQATGGAASALASVVAAKAAGGVGASPPNSGGRTGGTVPQKLQHRPTHGGSSSTLPSSPSSSPSTSPFNTSSPSLPVSSRPKGSTISGRWQMQGPNRIWSKATSPLPVPLATAPGSGGGGGGGGGSGGTGAGTGAGGSVIGGGGPKPSYAKQSHTISGATSRAWTAAGGGVGGGGGGGKARPTTPHQV